MVIYTNILIPKGFDAVTLGFIILMRPSKRHNVPLHAHEKVHVRQFWRSFGTFPFRYLINADYRIKCEVEAYRASVKHGMSPHDAANNLTRYKSELTYGEAVALLGSKND